MLSLKLATLLALATLLRSAELASITFESLNCSAHSAAFALDRPRKAQHTGALRSFTLRAYNVPNLYPVACLSAYIQLTSERRATRSGRLLISLIPPHNDASGSTLARWIRNFLGPVGIDNTVFGAHSTRGAASSGAISSGTPIEQV